MKDQADKLRQIISNIKSKNVVTPEVQPKEIPKRTSRVITVTSGKGGVGKTNVAVNLGITLSEYGFKVIILDADFGLANIDVLFGIVPRFTLLDVINNKKNIAEILTEGPKNLKFISGGSGVEQLAKLDKVQLEKFIENISVLDKLADYIIIDTGAGVSENVISFVMAADEVLLVTNPEPTSITDAYALIKMVSNRDKNKNIKLIVNRAENQIEAENILKKLSMVADKFLSIKLSPLGYLINDEIVSKSVKMQQPFTIAFPKSNPTKQIRDICKKLVQIKVERDQGGIKSFVNKLVSFLNT
ncbi:MAG: MinD/ParA family protein [Deltaproteobacteria bacterium]